MVEHLPLQLVALMVLVMVMVPVMVMVVVMVEVMAVVMVWHHPLRCFQGLAAVSEEHLL